MSATTSAESQPNKRPKLELFSIDPKVSLTTSSAAVVTKCDKRDHPLVSLSDSDVQTLLSQYECPVCLEHISPPILQCPNGHVFCRSCRQKLSAPVRCPTCREPLPAKDIHSHPMEQMAVNLRLPFQCKFHSFGCTVSTLLPDKAIHEDSCDFRPFDCPIVRGQCKWFGSGEQVVQHLVDVHKYKSKEARVLRLIYSLNDVTNMDNFNRYKFFSYKNHHFIYNFVKRVINSHDIVFKAFLVFIGEQRIADKFKYKLDIYDQKDDIGVQFKGRPNSIRQKVSALAFGGLTLDSVTAKQFIRDNKLKITLEVIEAK